MRWKDVSLIRQAVCFDWSLASQLGRETRLLQIVWHAMQICLTDPSKCQFRYFDKRSRGKPTLPPPPSLPRSEADANFWMASVCEGRGCCCLVYAAQRKYGVRCAFRNLSFVDKFEKYSAGQFGDTVAAVLPSWISGTS